VSIRISIRSMVLYYLGKNPGKSVNEIAIGIRESPTSVSGALYGMLHTGQVRRAKVDGTTMFIYSINPAGQEQEANEQH
jgi:hypothetical protein